MVRSNLISIAFALLSGSLLGLSAHGRNLTATLDVLSYNDVYEMLPDDVDGFKLGGPSRVIPIAKELRKTTPNSLVLFAGDTMSPSLWSFQYKGMQMVEAHNALGLDFASLGNHEFDFGLEAFWNVTQASRFPWLNANCYEESSKELLRGTVPNAVKEFGCDETGKFRVGLFGIMYDMGKTGKGLYWTDPIEVAQEQVKYLREEKKVDFVIALTHQFIADDNRLSKEVEGIDIIYGGHEHRTMLQTNYGTPYVKADFNFRSIWKSHIKYYGPEGKEPGTSRITYEAVPITGDMESDSEFDALVQEFAKEIAVIHNRTAGALCEPLDLTNEAVRASDAPVGSIFADASLVFYGEDTADAALINGGVIRSDRVYPAGPITLGQIVAWSPFGNTVIITETDGASVKAFITMQMKASCGNGFVELNGQYVHPAGLKYQFQCTGAKTGELKMIEWFKHPSKTGPVEDSETIRLATTDYVFNTAFSQIPDVKTKMLVDEAESIRIDAAVETLLQSQPEKTFCYKSEGRSEVLL